MTRNEAYEIEEKVDRAFSSSVGEKCRCSFTLSGRLQVSIGKDAEFCLSRDKTTIEWVSFVGFYDYLKSYIDSILLCAHSNSDLIDQLIWSYEHVTELED